MNGFAKFGFLHSIGMIYRMHFPIRTQMGELVSIPTVKNIGPCSLSEPSAALAHLLRQRLDGAGTITVHYSSAICTAMQAGVLVSGNPSVRVDDLEIPAQIVERNLEL